MEVTVVGDVNPDILYHTNDFPARDAQETASSLTVKLGGSAANTAYALAKLGTSIHFYGAVGKDFMGDFCEREMNSAGIRTHLMKVNAKTGVTSAVECKGTRTMFTYRGANEFLDSGYVNPHGKWMHISGYWHLKKLRPHICDLLKSAKNKGIKTSFDVGSWSNDWGEAKYILNAIEDGLLDFIFMSEREITALTGEALETAVEKLRKCVTIGLHLGRRGAKMVGNDFEIYTPAVEGIPVRYTTGAGDTWNAGFIWGLLETDNFKKASKIAMEVVEGYVQGGTVAIPSGL